MDETRSLAFFQKLSPCLIGIEACATSHHWSREPKALGHRAPDAAGPHQRAEHMAAPTNAAT